MTKRLYIETLGCQMNVLDSELVAAGLVEAGYELVDRPSRPIPSSSIRAASANMPKTRSIPPWAG